MILEANEAFMVLIIILVVNTNKVYWWILRHDFKTKLFWVKAIFISGTCLQNGCFFICHYYGSLEHIEHPPWPKRNFVSTESLYIMTYLLTINIFWLTRLYKCHLFATCWLVRYCTNWVKYQFLCPHNVSPCRFVQPAENNKPNR